MSAAVTAIHTGAAEPITARIYRVVRAVHPLFDGMGAARFGARWTSPGQAVIYTAGSYAGALLEILVHARRVALREPYHACAIGIPESVTVRTVRSDDVPGWDNMDYIAARVVGDAWLAEGDTAVLRVPAMTGQPHEAHYLINPAHPESRLLHIGSPHNVQWDGRLMR